MSLAVLTAAMPRRFVEARRRDPYYRAAQREGLRSRAAFKLAYLDDRFRLLAPRARVLDLGAAPGGWSTVARQRLGPRGEVVAVDPRPIEPIEGVRVVRGRVGDASLAARLGPRPFDVVLSDMSPRISGAYATDHARSVALVREAFGLARELLAPGGLFVAKVFAGDLLDGLEQELGRSFDRVRRTKPPASREPSSELYLLAFGYRPPRVVPDRERVPAPPPASDI
jgi:23S rRNA (uridine2552-2'-O)-methyltransferase